VVNLALDTRGELKDVELRIRDIRAVKRAWSCFHARGFPAKAGSNGSVVLTLPTLGPADVIVLEH
jgi:hypothetical protein